jgi:hypothetical protein
MTVHRTGQSCCRLLSSMTHRIRLVTSQLDQPTSSIAIPCIVVPGSCCASQVDATPDVLK